MLKPVVVDSFTVLDEFALAAMKVLLEDSKLKRLPLIARTSYTLAREMMEERERYK